MHSLDNKLKEKEDEISRLKSELGEQRVAVKAVAVTKDKLEIKASSRDMEEKLEVSISQFKVMDLNMGRETEDRKEICKKGMEELGKQVRSDLKKEGTSWLLGWTLSPWQGRQLSRTRQGSIIRPLSCS